MDKVVKWVIKWGIFLKIIPLESFNYSNINYKKNILNIEKEKKE